MISRRAFLAGGLAVLAWPRAARADHHEAPAPGIVTPEGAIDAATLEKSDYAYISPLRADGAESTCHGEVWYAFLDGAVLTTTRATTWKARALARGLDRARIWIGSHGPWQGGRNQAFRSAPSFTARAIRESDAGLGERILAVYERKYPEEIGRWRGRMRDEVASGKRVILRYQPIGG